MDQSKSFKTLARHVQQYFHNMDSLKRRRSLRPLSHFHEIDLTHNDYMGLRENSAFQSRAHNAAKAWPVGSGASRLLGGEYAIFGELEKEFAVWKGAESALYFPSGYAANEALMCALNLGPTVFFSDELNHASLIDGMRLARLDPQQKQIFPHNDLVSLQEKLSACTAPVKIVVVETLYSMDGDFCPARELVQLCQDQGALLVVDEAHALGVYGPEGRGWMAAQGIDPKLYISVNPCGKAMAASGAFISGPLWLREYLINTARSFIYTTGPSPWVAAALLESLATIRQLNQERRVFLSRCERIGQALQNIGFNCGTAHSHIIPVILGRDAIAVSAEQFCAERGLSVRAIRPPTVPEESCRLRLSLHAGLDDADEELLIRVFKELYYAFSGDLHQWHQH